MKRILVIWLLMLLTGYVYSQGLSCEESDPFCTGTIYNFPAGTTGTAQSGPYYGCLGTQPAPAWYHMRIGDPGPITIYMYSTPLRDIDFICWGPFSDPFAPCAGGLTASTVVDCSFSPDPQEWCDIPNGQTGQYYILLITNYSTQPCNITFSQSAGTGTTDCTILPPLINNNGPLCVGETLYLTAETIVNATYAWTGPNGFSSNIQNPVIYNVTLAHAGDYNCIITIAGQNSTPAVTTVVINDLPDASVVDPDTTTCPGATVLMQVYLTGAGPFEVHYYNGSNYFIAAGLTAPVDTIILTPPGPANYSLTQVSDTYCTRSLTGQNFHVYNYTVPAGSLSGSAIICNGDTTSLVFNLTGTPPWLITYTANGSPQTITATSTPFYLPVSPPVTTTYQFTQLSDLHCNGTAGGQAVVTIDDPTGTMSGNNVICAGETTNLVFILTGYPPWTITYTQNGGNAQTVIATYSPYSIGVAPMISTLYEFTALTDTYCEGTATGQAQVTVNQPSGILNGADTICSGSSSQIEFNLTGNPPWTITFSANGANPVTVYAYSTPYYQPVSPVITTTYTFTYFTDNECEGLTSGTALITVNPDPVASAGPDKTIANGTSTTLNGSVTGGSGSYVYNWEPQEKLINPHALQPQTVNLNATTLFNMEVTDNNGGCQGDDEVLVTVTGGVLGCYPIALPTTICQGELSHLNAMASGGSGNYTYSWSSDPPGFSSDLQNPTVSPDLTTTYHIFVDDGYNSVTGNVTVLVNLLPVPNAGEDQVIPFGTPANLNGSATSGSGYYTFHWEPAGKLINPDVPQPVTINLQQTTVFNLSVTDAQTGCVCRETDAVAVIINGDALNVNPMTQPSTICKGDTAKLFSLAFGGTGIYTYSWTSSPPGFTSSLPDPQVNPVVSTVYYLSVSDGFNTATGFTGITVNPTPVIDLGNDTTICVFDTITIDAGNPGSSYIWSNGSSERTISIATTGIAFDFKTVGVTVISTEGCESTGSRNIMFDFAACSGMEDSNPNTGFSIYPNPGNGLITIENHQLSGKYLLTVINSNGCPLIKDQEILFLQTHDQTGLDLRNYPGGLYMIRIIGKGTEQFHGKIVIVR
jgi:hypothetical protein